MENQGWWPHVLPWCFLPQRARTRVKPTRTELQLVSKSNKNNIFLKVSWIFARGRKKKSAPSYNVIKVPQCPSSSELFSFFFFLLSSRRFVSPSLVSPVALLLTSNKSCCLCWNVQQTPATFPNQTNETESLKANLLVKQLLHHWSLVYNPIFVLLFTLPVLFSILDLQLLQDFDFVNSLSRYKMDYNIWEEVVVAHM